MSEANVSPQALSKFFSDLYHYGLEKAAHRWYSVYEAEVVSVKDDPDGTARIDLVCPLISDDTIREARPIFPIGGFLPPYVGDKVWVMFKQGDLHRPLYVGGWVTISSGEQPPPSDVETPTQPTTRVIKFKTGAIVFEDGGSDKRIELYTKDLDGDTKNRSISLSDTMEQIVVRAKNGHYVQLDDMANFFKLFVDTSGGTGATGHTFLVDGDGKQISLKTALEQELLLDDNTMTMQLKNQVGDNLTIQSAKLLRLASALGVGMEILPATNTITIKDVAGNLIAITPAGIQIVSASTVSVVATGALTQVAAGIAQVSGGGAPVTTFGTGAASSLFMGAVTSTVIGAVSAILLGGMSIVSVGAISVVGTIVSVGIGATALLKAVELKAWLKAHVHPVTSAPGVTGTPTTGAALDVAGFAETTILKGA